MPRSSASPIKVRAIATGRRKPPASVDDLALMLQIDYLRGDNNLFLRRLQQALEDAFRQGAGKPH